MKCALSYKFEVKSNNPDKNIELHRSNMFAGEKCGKQHPTEVSIKCVVKEVENLIDGFLPPHCYNWIVNVFETGYNGYEGFRKLNFFDARGDKITITLALIEPDAVYETEPTAV